MILPHEIQKDVNGLNLAFASIELESAYEKNYVGECQSWQLPIEKITQRNFVLGPYYQEAAPEFRKTPVGERAILNAFLSLLTVCNLPDLRVEEVTPSRDLFTWFMKLDTVGRTYPNHEFYAYRYAEQQAKEHGEGLDYTRALEKDPLQDVDPNAYYFKQPAIQTMLLDSFNAAAARLGALEREEKANFRIQAKQSAKRMYFNQEKRQEFVSEEMGRYLPKYSRLREFMQDLSERTNPRLIRQEISIVEQLGLDQFGNNSLFNLLEPLLDRWKHEDEKNELKILSHLTGPMLRFVRQKEAMQQNLESTPLLPEASLEAPHDDPQ